MFRYLYIICIQRFWSDASYVSVKGMKTFCITVYLRSCSLRKSKAHVLHAPVHHMQWLHTILPIYATRNSHVECHPQVVALVPVLGQGYSNLYEDTQVVLLLTLIEVLLHSANKFVWVFGGFSTLELSSFQSPNACPAFPSSATLWCLSCQVSWCVPANPNTARVHHLPRLHPLFADFLWPIQQLRSSFSTCPNYDFAWFRNCPESMVVLHFTTSKSLHIWGNVF